MKLKRSAERNARFSTNEEEKKPLKSEEAFFRKRMAEITKIYDPFRRKV